MPPRGRTIAIGDIHGCLAALDAILSLIAPGPDDLIIPLGDYVDRGPDSRGVLDRLIRLGGECRLAPILGNHDELMLEAFRSGQELATWLMMGGVATLKSYGGDRSADLGIIPREHIDFLESCGDYLETETHIFLHASYIPDLPMHRQPESVLRWASLRDGIPGPHCSGKMVIAGHTSQKSGEVLDHGHLKCIDTRCYGGQWLTALDVHTGELWQVSREGVSRDARP